MNHQLTDDDRRKEELIRAEAFFDVKEVRDKLERDKEKRKKYRKAVSTTVCIIAAIIIFYVRYFKSIQDYFL